MKFLNKISLVLFFVFLFHAFSFGADNDKPLFNYTNLDKLNNGLISVTASFIDTIGEHDITSYEEIFLTLQYANIVKTTISLYYKGNRYFIPMGEVFKLLLIKHNIDYKNNQIDGFINHPKNNFHFDFNDLKFSSPKVNLKFRRVDYISTDLEYFIDSELISRMLGITFSVDFSNLILRVISKTPLPVYDKMIRQQKYKSLKSGEEINKYRHFINRDPNIFDGGVVDYSISTTYNKYSKPFNNFNIGTGSELLGGDIETSFNGGFFGNKSLPLNVEYRWRFGLTKNPYLTQVILGDIISSGLNAYKYEGVRFTNYPIEPRKSFSFYKLIDRTNPDWTVEMYMNDQLVDYVQADALGNFSFNLPLSYGSSLIMLKFYGPNGEYYEDKRYYQIPFEFNPPQELTYEVEFGENDLTNKIISKVSSIYGVTNWLSNKIGLEYIQNGLMDKPIIFNSSSVRLSPSYLFNLLIAPDAYYRFSTNILFYSQTSINASVTSYNSNPFYNPSEIENEYLISTYIPFYMQGAVLNLQASGKFQQLRKSKRMEFRMNTGANFGNIYPTLGFDYFRNENNSFDYKKSFTSAGLLFTPGNILNNSLFLTGNLINSRIFYDNTTKKIDNYFVSYSTNIIPGGRVQVSYQNNVSSNFDLLQFQFTADFESIRFWSITSSTSTTNRISGSFIYDKFINDFHYSNRSQLRRSAALFRLFIDSNFNGKYDSNEELVMGGKVLLESAADIKQLNDGLIIAKDLDPYSIYNVRVDATSIKNPLLVPRDSEFSFVSEPNSVKAIDVPFYIGGEISGSVYQLFGDKKKVISGIQLSIVSMESDFKKTITTFSDGTFYSFGLIPGKYKLKLNQKQLDILNVYSSPGDRIINILQQEFGDSKINLNFELHKVKHKN